MALLFQQNKKAAQKKIKILLFRAAVSLGILVLLFYFISFDEFTTALQSISLISWAMIIIAFLIGHIISAFKWRLVIRSSGVNVSSYLAIKAHAAGLFANLCLPSIIGGDVIRAGMLVKNQGNIEAITIGSLMDRVNDTIALILIASIASIFISQNISSETKLAFSLIAVFVFISVISGILILKFVPAEKFPNTLIATISKIQQSMNSLYSNPKSAILAFCLSLIVQSGFVILNIMLAQIIGIDIEHAIWFWAWPLAKLIALAPISLGGLGVREAALAGLLTPFGIDSTLAVSQGISWQAVLISSGILSGLFVLISRINYQKVNGD